MRRWRFPCRREAILEPWLHRLQDVVGACNGDHDDHAACLTAGGICVVFVKNTLISQQVGEVSVHGHRGSCQADSTIWRFESQGSRPQPTNCAAGTLFVSVQFGHHLLTQVACLPRRSGFIAFLGPQDARLQVVSRPDRESEMER